MNMRPKLLALEKNILKYRAFQMILLLHQVESLKSFALDSIRYTDRIFSEKNKKNNERLPEGTKKLFPKVWAILVNEKILTEEESNDIQRIINIRNKIGHSIHSLVSDVSAKDYGFDIESRLDELDELYDYYALERFEKYRLKIELGMSKKYVLSVSMNQLFFEEAEKTYKEELNRLTKKIERQFSERLSKREEMYEKYSNIIC
jgi:hypothetical protein